MKKFSLIISNNNENYSIVFRCTKVTEEGEELVDSLIKSNITLEESLELQKQFIDRWQQ